MTGTSIQFLRLDRQYRSIKDEIISETHQVLNSGKMLDGPYTELFEEAIAERTNRKYATAVNSCSQALLFSYLYYSLKVNYKKVAIPALSFIATSNAPTMISLDVKYIDVDSRTGIMDIDKINIQEDQLGMVSYVNLYGDIIDYPKLYALAKFFNKDLPILEDAAQSFGASINGIPSGKLGDVSCLSFDPTKNLPNYGSGGMVLTDDPNITQFVTAMRSNGAQLTSKFCGTNSRMSESDCAQMLVKLKYFDGWQKRRAEIAEYYTKHLKEYVICPEPSPGVIHSWHKYVIQFKHLVERNAMQKMLKDKDIETKIHYYLTLPHSGHLYTDPDNRCPVAEELSSVVLSLPIYPEMTDLEVEYVVSSFKECHTYLQNKHATISIQTYS